MLFLVVLLAHASCGNCSDAIVSIALHPTNPNIVYVATTNESVYHTRDRALQPCSCVVLYGISANSSE